MKKELLDSITNPKTVLEFGNIKVHLEGVTPEQEAWIVAPMTRNYQTQPEVDEASAEYIQRLVRSCVKKIEGVYLKNEDGTEYAFEVQFIDDSKKLIDLTTYVFISKLFNKLLKDYSVDFGEKTVEFYKSSLFLPDGIRLDIDDKKKV